MYQILWPFVGVSEGKCVVSTNKRTLRWAALIHPCFVGDTWRGPTQTPTKAWVNKLIYYRIGTENFGRKDFLHVTPSNDMNKVITGLRLDNSRNCSRNIWLSFLAVLVLISINYRALIMPLWVIILISILILIFSAMSFIAFIYWMTTSWNDYSIELRLGKVFYLLILGIINLISFYILLKVMSYPG